MQKIKLGHSDVSVSSLCMGSDLLGTKHGRDTTFALLDTFRENGGTFIDTGNIYAFWLPGFKGGESESVIGEWLEDRGCREEMVVGTKIGFDYPGCPGGLSAKEIEKEFDKSRKRLRSDYIDIYWSHRDDYDTPQAETMEAFDRLVKAGKVRALGASNLRIWRIAQANELARANGWTEYSAVEQRYTYLRPLPAADFGPQIFIGDELRDFAERTGVTMIAYAILLMGAYSKPGAELPPQFVGRDSEERLAALKAVAAETNSTVNQVIIAWIRQHRPSILPIIAGSKPGQIVESIEALKLELSPEQMERLNNAGNPEDKGGWLQPT